MKNNSKKFKYLSFTRVPVLCSLCTQRTEQSETQYQDTNNHLGDRNGSQVCLVDVPWPGYIWTTS